MEQEPKKESNEPDFSFLMPRGKQKPIVNKEKDRRLAGKARRKQRKEANAIGRESGE